MNDADPTPSPAAAYAEILARLDDIKSNRAEPIPLIDPTANVLKLVDQSVVRLNDLGATNEKWAERLRITEDKWAERVRLIEDRCKQEEAQLREKLSKAETGRIDAIRLADTTSVSGAFAEVKAAVALASERVSTANAALATTLAASTVAANDRMSRIEQQLSQRTGRDVEAGESRGQSNVIKGQQLQMVAMFVGWALTILMFFLKR